jgi:adenylate cyclase, class 2
MYIEIEAKLKVDSLKKVAHRLKARDAKFLRGAVHTDTYFDDARKSLRKSDSALRIRRQVMDRGKPRHPGVITFKGPRRRGRFKQRQEIQFGISDADIAEMFLAAIGYKKTLVYQKRRRVWRLGGCEVALDELPFLGCFVEIEGPNEKKIADVQKKLGLEDLPHIRHSYAVMMTKELRRRRRKSNRVFF